MRIFISWSGNLSHRVALILREWLPNVIQTVELYVSSEDIDKGTRWASDISKELEGASLGIICLTRSNLSAPWILFEAGALSKSIESSRVVPLLIDISPSDVQGPLVQFQASSITEEDIRKMVVDINASMGNQAIDPKRVERSFHKWWPDLEGSFQDAKAHASESTATASVRSERELLEETLDLARQISKGAAGELETLTRLKADFEAAAESLSHRFESSIAAMIKEFSAIVQQKNSWKLYPKDETRERGLEHGYRIMKSEVDRLRLENETLKANLKAVSDPRRVDASE